MWLTGQFLTACTSLWVAGDHDYPDYCRMWGACDSCERSVHFNTVYQLHGEYEKTPPMTWTDAEQYCVSNGGHLASIHSQAEHDLVWAVARGERVCAHCHSARLLLA